MRVTVVAEDHGTDRAPNKSDEISAKGGERRRERIRVGEVELAKHQSGRSTVDKKIVPLDGGADG
jgi:hypothetical protein